MGSGRTARILAFTIGALLCVAAGVWLAPRVRTDGGTSQVGASPGDAYRAETGTALLEVLPPASSDGAVDAAWQRAIATHAARIADPAVIGRVVGDSGAIARTRWGAKAGTPAHAGAVAGVRRALTVRPIPGTALIAVRVDVEPQAEAVVLTDALCEAYLGQCRRLSEEHGVERRAMLKDRAQHLEKQREERLSYAQQIGRPFGGDPQVSREQLSAAAARLSRLQDALADARAARPTTAPDAAGASRDPKELEQLIKAATGELEKTAEVAAQFKECYESAAELGDHLRRLRAEIERVEQSELDRQPGVRIVLRAAGGP